MEVCGGVTVYCVCLVVWLVVPDFHCLGDQGQGSLSDWSAVSLRHHQPRPDRDTSVCGGPRQGCKLFFVQLGGRRGERREGGREGGRREGERKGGREGLREGGRRVRGKKGECACLSPQLMHTFTTGEWH